jgi:hypothetical protein
VFLTAIIAAIVLRDVRPGSDPAPDLELSEVPTGI